MTPLTPAEHSGLRELFLSLQALQDHWAELSGQIAHREVAEALRFGTHRAGGLLRELKQATEAYGTYGGPGAQGVGRLAAMARRWLGDPFLDQTRAARLANLHAAHISGLLAYLAAAAEHRRDSERARLYRTWEGRFDDLSAKVRAAVCEMAGDEQGTLPVDNGPVGRIAGHLLNVAGNLVEAADQRLLERRGDA